MYKSKQEVFDIVAEHLLTQNAKSIEPSTTWCLYRGPEGRMCAFGVLIPDELYSPTLEKRTVVSLANSSLIKALFEGNLDDWTYFLQELQDIHDQNEPKEWPGMLAKFAWEYKLDNKVVGQTLVTKVAEPV